MVNIWLLYGYYIFIIWLTWPGFVDQHSSTMVCVWHDPMYYPSGATWRNGLEDERRRFTLHLRDPCDPCDPQPFPGTKLRIIVYMMLYDNTMNIIMV